MCFTATGHCNEPKRILWLEKWSFQNLVWTRLRASYIWIKGNKRFHIQLSVRLTICCSFCYFLLIDSKKTKETDSCILEEGLSCWHIQGHTCALNPPFHSIDGTTSPHLSSESCHAWLQKKELSSSLIKFLFTELTLTHTHTHDVCLYPVSDLTGKMVSAGSKSTDVLLYLCMSVCIRPLFFCLLPFPWNLTGMLLFIHFILFVCCMCVSVII